MKISQFTTAFQLRIILTREIHTIDKFTQFPTDILERLVSVSEKMAKVLEIEQLAVTTLVIKELIGLDIEAVKLNTEVIKFAIKLKMFTFDAGDEFIECGINMN